MTNRQLILVAALTFCAGTASAQAIHTFIHTTLDGLPSAVVNDVAQVEDDSIWVATDRGLASFDGRKWKSFISEHRRCRWIHAAPDGGAWVAGYHAKDGIIRLNADGEIVFETSLPASIRPDQFVSSIASCIDDRGRTSVAVALGEYGIWILVDSGWKRLGSDGAAPIVGNTVARGPGGELWACTAAGLIVWDGDGESRSISPSACGAPDDAVLAIGFESSGRFAPWLVGRTWIGRLNAANRIEHLVRTRPFLTHPTIAPDQPHGVYFGDAAGVFHLDLTTSIVRELGVAESMAGTGTHAIHRDRDQNFWVACGRGITRIPPHRFHEFDSRHGLLENEVTAIEFSRDRIVFGHNFGLSWLEDGRFHTWEIPPEKRGDNCRVLDLEKDTDGRVWFAAHHAGLGLLDADGRISFFDEPDRRDPIACIHIDDDGVMWRGTVGHGIQRRENGRFVAANEGLPSPISVRRIERAPGGDMFVATMSHGLFQGRPGRWESISGPNASNVFSVARYRGRTLLGTRMGLLVSDKDGLEFLNLGDFTINYTTFALHVSPGGRLWAGTDRGVYSWNGSRWLLYNPHTGLAGREANRDAIGTDDSGNTWIGTEDGLSLFLGDVERPPRPPRLWITAATAGGKPIDGVEVARVASSDNTLVFKVRAMSFVADGHIDVQWRLTGRDADWRTTDAEHAEELVYSNLPPGRYRLEVRAANARNEWSETAMSPEIVVAAPLWRRTWFIASLTLAIGLIGWGFAAFIVVRRESTRLERLVQERTAELLALQRELHNTEKLSALGQLAGGVAHDFNNLLTAIVGSCEMMRIGLGHDDSRLADIEPIEQAAHSGAELVQKLLAIGRRQRLEPRPTDINRSLREFGRIARRVLDDRIVLELSTSDDPVVAMVDPSQLDHVIMNLLINAGDAMPEGGRVTVTTDVVSVAIGEFERLPAGRYARMRVSDEGCGIPDDVVNRIFEPFFTTKSPGRGTGLGLAMVYGAARQAGGDVLVKTGTDVGTTFTLYLPESIEAPVEPTLSRKPSNSSRPRKSVLLVDDDEAVLELTARMLSQLGCDVVAASSGDEALEFAANGSSFDILLTDVVMPGMTGPELAREMAQRCRDVTIRYMTGYADLGKIGQELPDDAVVLKKPFRLADLRESLDEAAAGAARGQVQ